jgi:AcrR family transcriptional regulator
MVSALRSGERVLTPRARNRRATPAELRERVLDAAETCFQREGVTRSTVDSIAAAAGISRATLYRSFAGRNELVLAVLMREVDRITGQLITSILQFDSAEDVITEGIIIAVRTVRDNRTLSMLFGPDAAAVTGRIAGSSEALLGRARHFGRILLGTLSPDARSRLRPQLGTDEVADHLVRVVLGFVVLPTPDHWSELDLRRYIRTFVVPAIVVDEDAVTVRP